MGAKLESVRVKIRTKRLGLSVMYPLSFIITLLVVSLGHPVPVPVQLSEKDLGRTVEIGVGDILDLAFGGCQGSCHLNMHFFILLV